ncbi:hypothetical protein RTP6_006528 [Batrachochytrium dendrobatidis]
MKLSVAVLSSILLTCSVTIAKPVHPSTTASTDHVSSTVVPSSTTSTESNPSETPNTSSAGLGRHAPFSKDMKELLKNYSNRNHECTKQEEDCELIDLEIEDQEKLVKALEKDIQALENGPEEIRLRNSKYSNDLNAKRHKRRLYKEKSKLEDLKKKAKKCQSKLKSCKNKLKHCKEKVVQFVFKGPFDPEHLEDYFSRTVSKSLVKKYLLKISKKTCKKGFGQGFPTGKRQNPSSDYDSDTDTEQDPDAEQQGPDAEQQGPDAEQDPDADAEQEN